MDTYIDPLTGAYISTGTDLQRDQAGGLANAVYLRLMTPLGSYWAAPTVGSRLHELVRSKGLPNREVIARQYAQAALQPIVDDGRAQSITITTRLQPMADASKALQMLIEVVDASGQAYTFSHHVPVA